MSFFRTDDPIADFDRYDAEQQAKLDKLPECSECGHPIQDEHFYLINDECICVDCLNDNYKKRIDEFV